MIERMVRLVKAYQDHILQYSKQEYNETEVRNDFVNPFFEILGWDVLNKKNLPQHLREVKHEASVMVDDGGENKKKKPDYAFNLGTETMFFLETKKPAVNIMQSKNSAFQLRRYGWNGNLNVSVLSNFTDLIIYDCTVRPIEDDDVMQAMVAHYHYTEYLDKFDEISLLLSRDSIVTGRFEQYFSKLTSSLKKEPFNQYFLEQIKSWRYKLSIDIFKYNKQLDEESLNIFVQRMLNRIIFLRICEDRNLEIYETLKKIESYNELKTVFYNADLKYDSGLFELIDEQSIVISDSLIIEIFRDLYYPNSCYEFSVVEPYIIGQIYELFLAEKVHISETGDIEVVKKPEIVDSQGVVNTPKNITDIIVEQTLSSLYEGKEVHVTKEYRIADLCCGSGNFLLSAYEFIINKYIEFYKNSCKEEALHEGIIYRLGEDLYGLSFEEKRNILENNLYGVDIDTLAVEVTKFSLLLKLIDGCSRNEIEYFANENKCRILPNLDGNIRNGNSLVDFTYIDYDDSFYETPNLYTKLKLFDWENEFENKKFDAIIGNPPYIRVQNMVHYSPEEYNYYKSDFAPYSTAKAELMDKYYLFLERALSLLKECGSLGYIIPHKFMLIKTGLELRKFLSEKKCVRRIVHFGTNQVFAGRSTYTCLLFLSGNQQKSFEIGFVKDINVFYNNPNIKMKQYPIEYLGTAPWSFMSDDISLVLERIARKCQPLNTYSEIFVGLQTSADNIYIIEPIRDEGEYTYFIDKNGCEQHVESAILKPCIYDIRLEKYKEIEANKKIIFPYHFFVKKPMLYTLAEMETNFPETLKYLYNFKYELDRRNIPKRNEENWYQFGRSQSLKRFTNKEHLIWSVLSTTGNYVFDDSGISFTGGGNGPFYGLEMKSEREESIFYIQALLNHWLLEAVVKSKASTFRGDYYSHGKQFVELLPIYKIDFTKPGEVRIHDFIVDKVKNIMTLKQKREKQNTREQKKNIQRLIQNEVENLNNAITNLYGASEIDLENQVE